MAPTTRSSRTPKGAAAQPSGTLGDPYPSVSGTDEFVPSTNKSKTSKKDKVYRKASPEPELEQLRFPARSKTVRQKKTSAGGAKKQRNSLPVSLSGKKSKGKKKDPKQSTLTQIGWVPSTFPEDDDDMDPVVVDLTGDTSDEDGEWGAVGAKGTRQKEERAEVKEADKSNRGRKRRKTTGDLDLESREDDEDEESIPSSRYHTQTLTQMPSWRPSEEDEDENGLAAMVVGDSGEDLDDDVGLVQNHPSLNASVAEREDIYDATPESKKRKRPSPAPQQGGPAQPHQEEPMPPPQGATSPLIPRTPSKPRLERTEIPSSQPSPFTPNLEIGHRHWSPLALGVDRTPLKDRSTNVDAPTPSASGRVLKRSRSEIPDSWSTVNGGVGSSPLNSLKGGSSQARRVKRTPLKEINFVDVEQAGVGDVSVELGENHGLPDSTDGRDGERTSQKSQRPDDEEVIMDSDEEFQGFPDDEPEAPGTPTLRRVADQIVDGTGSLPEVVEISNEEAAASTPSAGNIVTEEEIASHTLAEESPRRERPVEIVEVAVVEPETPTPSVPMTATQQPSSHPVTPEPPTEEDETEPETPTRPRRRPSSSSAVEKETPLSSPQKTSPAMPPVSQIGYSYKSQAFESQRVPFEIIRQMAPQTDRSDVIMSIHPEHVKQITDGTKTHEFRNYRLPQTVGRLWIYITRPVQELKYMAIISGYKLPGEIAPEDPGVGNRAFNEGKGAKYAYELKQVYQLNNPVSLARMKENGWVEQAPQKYEYVPPAVLGELMGNLRCALFEEHEQGEESGSQAAVTISQELREQFRSDIAHSTQLKGHPSSPQQRLHRDDVEGDEDGPGIVPSSQDAGIEVDEHVSATPPQTATTSARQMAFAKPSAPPSRSQRSVIQIDDSSPVARQSQSQHVVESTVRASQATTASASSQSQQLLSQRMSTQSRTPARRPQRTERSSMASLPEDVLVVDDSPVQMRAAGKNDDHTQSSLGLGMLLGSSSGLVGIDDSLMDDSRIRMPPGDGEVVWDSEGEVE